MVGVVLVALMTMLIQYLNARCLQDSSSIIVFLNVHQQRMVAEGFDHSKNDLDDEETACCC